MRLLGKLFIDKVTSEERGVYCRIGDYKLYETNDSFLYEYTWEGRRVVVKGSGADPIWVWKPL